MKTKSIRILLVLFLILCPYSLWAYDFEVDNIQYTIVSFDELTVEVSGLTDTNVNELIIPATVEYNGRTLTIVSIVDSAFKSNTNLQYVSILCNIFEIGNNTFYGCSSLLEVETPNSVTSIGDYAFYNCSSLTSIDIPNSVTSIGDYAFYNCSSLTSITIPEGVTIIEDYTFYNCYDLAEITIPESVTSIGNYVFANCWRITSINIPDGVVSIGNYAFYNCTHLASITIPEGVTSIGDEAFAYCTRLTSITIPNSVTTIGGAAFAYCSSLESITIPEGVTSIGNAAFRGCSSLASIDIPNNVTSIGNNVFVDCISLECFTIGNGIEYSYEYSSTNSGTNWYNPLLWSGAPTQMEKIVISDGSSSFGIRGYSYTKYPSQSMPSFSNIDVKYLYVGRQLIDITSWKYSYRGNNGVIQYINYSFSSKLTQPLGTIGTLEISGGCTDVPYFFQSIEKLILGEDVATYSISNIYQGELTEIMCKSTTPPSLSGTFDNRTYIDVTLYVPTSCKEIYQATDGWKNFWDIQEIDVNDMIPSYVPIESVPNIQAKVEGYYTISGQKINSPQHGINIVRYSDGTTKKVHVK